MNHPQKPGIGRHPAELVRLSSWFQFQSPRGTGLLLVRAGRGELPPDQVRCPAGSRIRHGGADRAGPGGPAPPAGPHDPLDGALRRRDALPLQVKPHLHAARQRLRRPPPVLARLVDPGQDLGDSRVPQCSPGWPGGQVRPAGSRGRPDAVRGQRTAYLCDPEPSLMASMKAQISGVAGRTPARRNSPPPSGSPCPLQLGVLALELADLPGRRTAPPAPARHRPRPAAATCAASPRSSPAVWISRIAAHSVS